MLPRLLVVVVALLAAGCVAAPGDTDADPRTPEAAAPTALDAVSFETDRGTFTAILFPNETPETVAFIERLVTNGYYDGREFNRIIPGFVIQEVDRVGGATDQTETVAAEFGTRVMFSAGALGIARNEDPDSGGSEFFVMDFAHSHLYGNYTAFAQVVEGLDVVREIARLPTVKTGPASALPLPPPLFVHDRVALQPAKIVRASMTTVELPAEVARRYPLVVGPSTSLPGGRATLEWPADLAPARESELTWYVFTRDGSEAPDLSGARVVVRAPDGGVDARSVRPDEADAAILHWRWTPRAEGVHNVTLETRNGGVAWSDVRIARG